MKAILVSLAVLFIVATLVLPVAAADPAVTFGANIGDNAQGTILTVDGTNYTIADLPKTFNWENATTHSFHFYSPISAGTGQQYIWNSTSGLSTLRFGNVTVIEDGQIWATYTWTEAPITPLNWFHEIMFGSMRWIFMLVVIILCVLVAAADWGAIVGFFILFFFSIWYFAAYTITEDLVCGILLLALSLFLLVQFIRRSI